MEKFCTQCGSEIRDAKKARELGAEGIGLCRTEHMFFEDGRIGPFREMICSDTVEEREEALAKILPMQQADFEGLYEVIPFASVSWIPLCTSSFPPPRKTLQLWQQLRARALQTSRLSSQASTSLTP